MREDIKSLKICGGKFAEEASLAFWGNTTQANKKLLALFYMAEMALVKVRLQELFVK